MVQTPDQQPAPFLFWRVSKCCFLKLTDMETTAPKCPGRTEGGTRGPPPASYKHCCMLTPCCQKQVQGANKAVKLITHINAVLGRGRSLTNLQHFTTHWSLAAQYVLLKIIAFEKKLSMTGDLFCFRETKVRYADAHHLPPQWTFRLSKRSNVAPRAQLTSTLFTFLVT